MTRDLHPEDYEYEVVWNGGALLPPREEKRHEMYADAAEEYKRKSDGRAVPVVQSGQVEEISKGETEGGGT